MKAELVAVTFCLAMAMATSAFAQHGTAPSGYYPFGYHGDTFTGIVTATDDATREITLTYTDSKRGKSEAFVGVLLEGYKVKLKTGGEHEIKPSEIPIGTRLIVYYLTKSKKVEGEKIKYNEVFLFHSATSAKN
jgi:hypothetical protein